MTRQGAYEAKALAALRTARMALQAGDVEGAANRAYYAMFHAVTGKLLSKGASPPKTHAGLASLFAEQCIKTGEYPSELSRLLASVARLR